MYLMFLFAGIDRKSEPIINLYIRTIGITNEAKKRVIKLVVL